MIFGETFSCNEEGVGDEVLNALSMTRRGLSWPLCPPTFLSAICGPRGRGHLWTSHLLSLRYPLYEGPRKDCDDAEERGLDDERRLFLPEKLDFFPEA